MNLPIEKQVTSLELSKRLKELGVKQESLWYYDDNGNLFMWNRTGNPEYEPDWDDCVSAFTASELGGVLPDKISPENQWDHYILYSMKNTSDGEWVVRYQIGSTIWCAVVGDTEAEARAKMLIHLLEQGLVEEKHDS